MYERERSYHSLVPGQGLVEKMGESGAEVLMTECSHAAKGARPSLRIRYQQQLVVYQVNQVRDLYSSSQGNDE